MAAAVGIPVRSLRVDREDRRTDRDSREESLSNHDSSIAILFTDGTRGWILGRNSVNVATSPDEKSMSRSLIIKPEEFADYQADKMRRSQAKQLDERRRKEAQFEQLKKELGKQ